MRKNTFGSIEWRDKMYQVIKSGKVKTFRKLITARKYAKKVPYSIIWNTVIGRKVKKGR